MALTFKSIVDNGGGDIAFLWHVAGYPWAVTNDQRLIDALSNTADSTVQAARKRLFGTNGWTLSDASTHYPAYGVPIFMGLKMEFGKQKYTLDESKGLLKGGDWSVKIEDRIHGHTWNHAVSTDEIWGLEGLHRVANVKRSLVHGWGYLDNNLLRIEDAYNPDHVDINEQSGNVLRARVAGLAQDDYVVIWCNKEAMAVDGVTGSFPDYQLDFTDYGGDDHRGLYRSRPQDHFVDALTDMNPIIADVPGSISGKACWLYGIPIVDGEVPLNGDGDPIIAELEGGIVTHNISTRDSVTSVRIRNKLSSLERSVSHSLGKSQAQETSLAGFVFSRGNSDCDLGSIQENVQMPHFVIRDYVPGWVHLLARLESGDSKTEHLDASNFAETYIWICDKNTTVFFETADQVMEALNNELIALAEGNSNRHSNGAVLHRPCAITKTSNGYKFGYSGILESTRQSLLTKYLTTPTEQDAIYSQITGPLAWLFALGAPTGGDSLNDNAYTRLKNRHLDIQRLETVYGPSVVGFSESTIPFFEQKNVRAWWMHEQPGERTYNIDVKDVAIPRYYHSWDWANTPITMQQNFAGIVPTRENWSVANISDWPSGEGSGIYLPSDTNINGWTEGERVSLGDGRWFPKITSNIDEIIEPSNTDLVELQLSTLSCEEPICAGASLFYLPLMEVWDEADYAEIPQLDPHYLTKTLSAESSSLSSILRSMLGENISGISIAKEIQISDNPLFSSVGDFTSSIDWLSLDSLRKVDGQTYWLDMADDDSETVYNILRYEILLHSAHMTREWDEENLMFLYRFRNLGPPSISAARSIGLSLDADKAMRGVPTESNGMSIPYNSINMEYSGATFIIENKNADIVGYDKRRTLVLKPKISQFNLRGIGAIYRYLADLVVALSNPSVEQSKNINLMQWLYPVGREIFVTDPSARDPFTHRLGLSTEPALITEHSFDINKQKGSISYRIGSYTDTESYGIAPACMLTSGNFSKSVGEFSGTPEDHQYSESNEIKDVYHFDCWDFPSGPGTPVARDCSCGQYKVWVHEVGTYNWTPLEFTCEVSSAGVITLYGTTTTINEANDYIVTFREWADLEDCQKYWCTMADDNNLIGASNVIARRWV